VHQSNLRNNKHKNQYLQNAWNKYGETAFVFGIIEYFNQDVLIEKEQYYIDITPKKYNLRLTAASNLGLSMSVETKEKIRNKALGRTPSTEVKSLLSTLKQKPKYIKIAIANLPVCTSGENNPRTKLSNSDIPKIIALINKGIRNKDICKEFPIKSNALTELKAGRSWKEFHHLINYKHAV
jgi:group I intron endonuclease